MQTEKKLRVKKQIDTVHIMDAFNAERALWIEQYPQAAGAMGCLLGRILSDQKVTDPRRGVELNIPEWFVQ